MSHAHAGHDHSGHDHEHTSTVTRDNERKVLLSFGLIFTFMIVEAVAGFINAITLFAVVGLIVYEAWQLFQEPSAMLAGPMLAVAVGGSWSIAADVGFASDDAFARASERRLGVRPEAYRQRFKLCPPNVGKVLKG